MFRILLVLRELNQPRWQECPPNLTVFLSAIVLFFLADLTTQAQSIYSHFLSWGILYCCLKVLPYLYARCRALPDRKSGRIEPANAINVNGLGFVIANAIVSQILCDVKWVTPLLFFITHYVLLYLENPVSDLVLPETNNYRRLPNKSLLYATLAAVLCFFMLPKSTTAGNAAIALWALVSEAAVFVLLERDISLQEEKLSSSFALLERVSSRVLLMLTVFVIVLSHSAPFVLELSSPAHLLPVAVAEALFWIALFVLTCQNRYGLASLCYTYSALSVRAFRGNDFLGATAPAGAALLALSQMRVLFPRMPQSWKILAPLVLLPLAALVNKIYMSVRILEDVDWDSGFLDATDCSGPLHPIERLVVGAQKRFHAMVRSQSKTLAQAVAEYKRRYKRSPPPGFDKWFALCLEKGLIFVDEFNGMMQALEPFWGLAPMELRHRVQFALQAEGICKMAVENGTLEGECWYSTEMRDMINLGVDLLPDMVMAFNTLDEARVVVPHDMLDFLRNRPRAAQLLNAPVGKRPMFIDIGHQNTWDQATLSCAVDSPGRSWQPNEPSNSTLTFITNMAETTDLCLRPEIAQQHGFFVSPASFWLTNTLVPIFSQGKPSTFQDILYPSPYYLANAGSYEEDRNISYRDKASRLYWAGSTTGGLVTTSNWQNLHRHRFVALANDDADTPVLILDEGPPTSGGKWKARPDVMSSLHNLFDVKFTNIVQCDTDTCANELPNHFTVGPSEDMSASLDSKLVMDLDGNGFSGRFYRLLRTNSAVLKQTILREWHDDWLVPWMHYVPASIEMMEVGEIVRFLTREERGLAVGQMIAEEGQKWANRALRLEDQGLALVRILLEYGRLLSDDRDELGCCERA